MIKRDITVTIHNDNVTCVCPCCCEEIYWTYKELCVYFGEPSEWNNNKFNCEYCGAELEISGSEVVNGKD